MRLMPQLIAASRRGLVRGTESFVTHAVRNFLLIFLSIGVIWFGWSYLSQWVGGWFHLPDWFGWPEILLPNWLGSGKTQPSLVTEPAAVEAKELACDGWGYKNWCWKH